MFVCSESSTLNIRFWLFHPKNFRSIKICLKISETHLSDYIKYLNCKNMDEFLEKFSHLQNPIEKDWILLYNVENDILSSYELIEMRLNENTKNTFT